MTKNVIGLCFSLHHAAMVGLPLAVPITDASESAFDAERPRARWALICQNDTLAAPDCELADVSFQFGLHGMILELVGAMLGALPLLGRQRQEKWGAGGQESSPA